MSQTDTALGITTSQTFDAFGNQLSQVNGRGFTSTASYHPVTGLLLSKADPLGHGPSYTYNALGLPTSVTNAIGKTSSTTFDAAGNVATTTDPMNKTTSYTRDLAGNTTSVTNAKNQTTLYEYDAWNRLTAVTTPKNERTEYTYLATGELAQVKDPLGNFTTFEYNTLGQLTKKTDALGFFITRQYDENGNVTQETDPNGNTKVFGYDSLNQLVRKTLPDNVVELTYDVRGNVTRAKNQQSQVDYFYDVGKRLTSVQTQGLGAYATLPNATLSFGYDFNGNRTSLTDPVGTTSYAFDQADRLTSLTNPKGETYTFTFDDANRMTAQTRPGGETTLAFDDRNFVTSIVHANNGATTLASFAYQMDEIGNRTQITTQAGARNLAYDPNNQLTSASNPEAQPASGFNAESFSYDAIANRKTDQGGGYTFDNKSQRLIEDYKNLYVFDNNGNMTSKQKKGLNGPVTNFEYTSENQLRAFKVFDPTFSNTNPAKEVVYVYDALGRRIAKQVVDHTAPNDPVKTFERRAVFDGQEMVLEYDGNNSLLARYTHSTLRTDDVLAVDVKNAGVTAALAQNAQSYQYLKDAQGTVTDVADTSGNKIQHYIYSAFGVLLGIQDANAADVTASPPLRTSYTYTGRELDQESGNYFYRARYYSAEIGRFLQKDPNPGKILEPHTVFNGYAYVGNNPINFADPTGMFRWATVAFGAALALSILFPPAGIAAVMLAGAGLGALGSLAAIENLKYGGSFESMVKTEGVGGIAKIAGIGAVAGAVGAWAGPQLATAIAGSNQGFWFGVFEGAFSNAITSGLDSFGQIYIGHTVKGDGNDVVASFAGGFILGGIIGGANVKLGESNSTYKFREPIVFFGNGGAFFLLTVAPADR